VIDSKAALGLHARQHLPPYSNLLMNKNLPHSLHFLPGNVRMLNFYLIWDVIAGLANNFKVSDNGVDNQITFFIQKQP
jgi:hypothetical protein